MRAILSILFMLLLPVYGYSQIHFTGSARMRIHDGAKVIIHNPTSNGITFTPGSGIVTDGENSKVVLNIGNSTGNFEIPFVSQYGNTIPFTYNITTAGDNINGRLILSSWGTDVNNNPLPASVTQFYTENIWGNWDISGGQRVINRFWSIDPSGYTTKPRGEYTFTYDLLEKPPLLVENLMTAQRWNDVEDTWLDWLYANTANIIDKTVYAIISNDEDQFPIWTLVDMADPLPIELIRFVGNCMGSYINISWTTWTEIDNEMFILERSLDGISFEEVTNVKGAGDSNTPLSYNVEMPIIEETHYYRLVDIDSQGNRKYSPIIAVTCGSNIFTNVSLHPNPTDGIIYIIGVDNPTVRVYDSIGRIVLEDKTNTIDLSDFSAGSYVVSVIHNDKNNFRIIKK